MGESPLAAASAAPHSLSLELRLQAPPPLQPRPAAQAGRPAAASASCSSSRESELPLGRAEPWPLSRQCAWCVAPCAEQPCQPWHALQLRSAAPHPSPRRRLCAPNFFVLSSLFPHRVCPVPPASLGCCSRLLVSRALKALPVALQIRRSTSLHASSFLSPRPQPAAR